MSKKIRVLVVDDSALIRQTLSEIINSDSDLEVMATAADPIMAAEKIKHEVPDVITLDVEMPRMDGLTFLHKLMQQHPIPVVMCSSLTVEGSQSAIKALEYGAVDIIVKPKMSTKTLLMEAKVAICDVIKAAAHAKIRKSTPHMEPAPKLSADVMLPPVHKAMLETTEKIIAIGASTGGTEALRTVLEMLPADTPGILIVQHMPEHFTKAFAERLNTLCKVTVKEAKDGDVVLRGQVLIAPGNYHMMLKRSGAKYFVEVKEGPLVSRHRPSVDVLFRSTARYAGKNAVGVIMTGMGDDGAKGLKEMKDAGAKTVAQDEATCVVYGMPKEAVKLGAADKSVPLQNIAGTILNLSN